MKIKVFSNKAFTLIEVLVVVLIFAVVIFGIDVGLGALVNLLKK